MSVPVSPLFPRWLPPSLNAVTRATPRLTRNWGSEDGAKREISVRG
jgi:hypothetical protein